MHAFVEARHEPLSIHLSTGLTFPLHLHPQLELFLVLTGSSSVTVRGQTQVLGPGALALIFPNQVHSYTALEPGTGAVLVVCDLSYTGGYADTLLRSHPEDPFLSGEKLHPNVPYAIQELEREARLQRESPVFGPLIQLVLARALPQLSLAKNSAADRRELTYQISQYVGEHFPGAPHLGHLGPGAGHEQVPPVPRVLREDGTELPGLPVPHPHLLRLLGFGGDRPLRHPNRRGVRL